MICRVLGGVFLRASRVDTLYDMTFSGWEGDFHEHNNSGQLQDRPEQEQKQA